MNTPEPVRAYLASIGSVGGSAKTKAKAEAVRANGKKGGRPKGSKGSKQRARARKAGPSGSLPRDLVLEISAAKSFLADLVVRAGKHERWRLEALERGDAEAAKLNNFMRTEIEFTAKEYCRITGLTIGG